MGAQSKLEKAKARIAISPEERALAAERAMEEGAVLEARRQAEFDERSLHEEWAAANPQASIKEALNIDGDYNEEGAFRPRRNPPLSPKVRQVFWCQFTDACLPEFGKCRPVLVVSREHRKNGHCLVLPITTVPQNEAMNNIHRLNANPNPNSSDRCWVVCDHVYAVSYHRLRPFYSRAKRRMEYPRLDVTEFASIMEKALGAFATGVLPSVNDAGEGLDNSVEEA